MPFDISIVFTIINQLCPTYFRHVSTIQKWSSQNVSFEMVMYNIGNMTVCDIYYSTEIMVLII